METIIEQFKNILDPSNALGAFLISVIASLIVGFFTGKNANNIQKAFFVKGDMIQDSHVYKKETK